MTAAVVLLALVTVGRVAELCLARRNTADLQRQGGVEVAPGHYPVIVALHAAWLGVLWVFGWDRPIVWGWLVLFLILQVARVWVLASLGRRWTTRIVVVPGETLVRRGPYRFVSHPNYLVVVGEIAALPLALGLPWVAAVFSVLNAAALSVRLRAENDALSGMRPYAVDV